MKSFILSLSLFAFLTAFSQDFDKKKMDSFTDYIRKNDKIMYNFAISQNGKEVYNSSVGYSDVDSKKEINDSTKFRIGSITKTFTAALIMKMKEVDLLQLNTPLSQYFSRIKNADKITIEDLLRHRSGIQNITETKDYLKWSTKPQSRDEMVRRIESLGSDFSPGTKFKYSNSNYILLSMIAERITRKNYSDLIELYINQGADLKNTLYGSKINIDNNEANSYMYDKARWEKSDETDMSVPLGAGGLISTPRDLNSFIYSLFHFKFLQKYSVDEMMKMEDDYGIGLFVQPFDKYNGYGHNGGIDEFASNSVFYPELDLAVSISSNGTDEVDINDIFMGYLSIYLGYPYEFLKFDKYITLEPEELSNYDGLYKSESLPIDLKIFVKDENLYAQGTDQPEFPLHAIEKDVFVFKPARIKILFNPDENKLTIFQGGQEFEMKR